MRLSLETIRRIMSYEHISDIHFVLLIFSIIIGVCLFCYFIVLHFRIEKAWHQVKILFPQRKLLSSQHWCLFAIRFSLLWLFLNLVLNITLLLNPIPPFIGDSTAISDLLWTRALESRNLMPYYKFVDLMGRIEGCFAYLVFWGSGRVCANMIASLARGRKNDKLADVKTPASVSILYTNSGNDSENSDRMAR